MHEGVGWLVFCIVVGALVVSVCHQGHDPTNDYWGEDDAADEE